MPSLNGLRYQLHKSLSCGCNNVIVLLMVSFDIPIPFARHLKGCAEENLSLFIQSFILFTFHKILTRLKKQPKQI
jgi:hypothetical protein